MAMYTNNFMVFVDFQPCFASQTSNRSKEQNFLPKHDMHIEVNDVR